MTNTKTPIAILGATGSVGQRLVQILSNHPWFEIAALCASEKSQGKTYAEATTWVLPGLVPESISNMKVLSPEVGIPGRIVFSALSSNIAQEAEARFANAGYIVISMAKNFRMDPTVPMVVPEVNYLHLEAIQHQKFANGGMIITKPNCSVIGLVVALKPLLDTFGLEAVHVVTMQSASGAGYPGVPSLALFDNIIPYISDEEEKLETEIEKIFGTYSDGKIVHKPLKVSATCTRVPVTEGHTEVVSVRLSKKATREQVLEAFRTFKSPIRELNLPSHPEKSLIYLDAPDAPQPRMHRDLEGGMAVTCGRLRPCSLFDFKFVMLSHNTLRGAAKGAVLIAEYLVSKKIVVKQ